MNSWMSDFKVGENCVWAQENRPDVAGGLIEIKPIKVDLWQKLRFFFFTDLVSLVLYLSSVKILEVLEIYKYFIFKFKKPMVKVCFIN